MEIANTTGYILEQDVLKTEFKAETDLNILAAAADRANIQKGSNICLRFPKGYLLWQIPPGVR